jgi:mono/diheme cytochrome c family protein
MTPARKAATHCFVLAGLSVLATSACSSSETRSQQVVHGKTLFELHCMGCHNGKRLDLAKRPPILNGLFQHARLPSGRSATDGQVRSTILGGRSGIMPPFDQTFTKEEINDIIRYLHTATEPPQAGADASNASIPRFPN